jgi:hypothetical protein
MKSGSHNQDQRSTAKQLLRGELLIAMRHWQQRQPAIRGQLQEMLLRVFEAKWRKLS